MKKLKQAIAETKEFMQLNIDPDADDEDAMESLEEDCGKQPDGTCLYAGTEQCDWECPFS